MSTEITFQDINGDPCPGDLK